MDDFLNKFKIIEFYFKVTEENIIFKRYQDYHDRFLWQTLKHKGTSWITVHSESEVLYEDIKAEIANVLGVLDTSNKDLKDETTGPLNSTKECQKVNKHVGHGIL